MMKANDLCSTVVSIEGMERSLMKKQRQLGLGAAQLLLAQQTEVLVTDDPRLTVESGMTIAKSVLALWQEGYYTPGPTYSSTLEEMLLELQEGSKAKGNYEASFQPFTPTKREIAWH
jgi:hypothetical protein